MGRLTKRELMQYEVDITRAKGYQAQAYGYSKILSIPFVGFIILAILFGPIVLTSFMKALPGIPLHIWIVGIVIIFVYRWLR